MKKRKNKYIYLHDRVPVSKVNIAKIKETKRKLNLRSQNDVISYLFKYMETTEDKMFSLGRPVKFNGR